MARRDFDEFPGARDDRVRERIEAALPSSVRAALPELLRSFGLNIPDRWPLHPVLRPLLEDVAVAVLMEAERERGGGEATARRLVCTRLRLNPASVAKRFRRHRKGYFRAVDKSRTSCPHGVERAG